MAICHLINWLYIRREWERHKLYFVYFDFWSATYLWMMRTFFQMSIEFQGIEKMPRGGPFILASKHLSFFDHLVNAELLRQLGSPHALWAMKAAVLNFPGLGGWAAAVGCATLKRGGDREGDIARLASMAQIALENNHSVVIYPQGRRAIGEVVRGKWPGFNCLATSLNYPIVYVDLDYGEDLSGRSLWEMGDFMDRHIVVTPTLAQRSMDEDLVASFENHFGPIQGEAAK